MVIGAAARVDIGSCRKLVSSHTSLLVSSQCRQMSMDAQSVSEKLMSSDLLRTQSLIDGKWIDSYDKKTIKIFQPKRTSAVSIEQKKKFQRKVLLLSKFQHENNVQFIGACIEPKLMIITELMEGNTLQKFMLSTQSRLLF